MSGLPVTIDPLELADRGQQLVGRLPLSGMPRLTASCLDDTGDVEIDLRFERDELGQLRHYAGQLRATLRMTCQRCLEPVELAIEAEPNVILLRAGEREDLEASGADTLVVEKPVALAELVEDELLLALPMFPAHATGRCRPGGDKTNQDGARHPFAALAGLKQDRH